VGIQWLILKNGGILFVSGESRWSEKYEIYSGIIRLIARLQPD
jgi:hypothetical protein